ncbi:hypothetical protein [Planktothrix mougeotii]|uniref:Uncharacterized protein n=1 Tax=Planktothrix mougeotii LEGE 06226 TaxID=1828728 RepID=A0ABR9UH56_9CYAN|nr:hypothetical protein [Planktothrix mougeotii]MBE9145805.1 hypothetical protein [Planktothrix mougeotii LEGE 06226]
MESPCVHAGADVKDFRNIQNYPQSVKPGFSLRLIVFHQYLFRNPVSTGDRTSPIPQLQSLIAIFSIDTLS